MILQALRNSDALVPTIQSQEIKSHIALWVFAGAFCDDGETTGHASLLLHTIVLALAENTASAVLLGRLEELHSLDDHVTGEASTGQQDALCGINGAELGAEGLHRHQGDIAVLGDLKEHALLDSVVLESVVVVLHLEKLSRIYL